MDLSHPCGAHLLVLGLARSKAHDSPGRAQRRYDDIPYPLIKKRFKRLRPFKVDPRSPSLSPTLDEHSFPSGHAMTLTGVLAPIVLLWPAMALSAVAMACCMAWSRIATGHHYPSDAAAGVCSACAWAILFRSTCWFIYRFYRGSAFVIRRELGAISSFPASVRPVSLSSSEKAYLYHRAAGETGRRRQASIRRLYKNASVSAFLLSAKRRRKATMSIKSAASIALTPGAAAAPAPGDKDVTAFQAG